MLLLGKLLLNYAANIVLWTYGLIHLRIGENLWWMGVKYGLCLIAAYYVSTFLDGRPSINVRTIVAGVLAFFTSNWIGAVVGPAIFGFSCIIIDSLLAYARSIRP